MNIFIILGIIFCIAFVLFFVWIFNNARAPKGIQRELENKQTADFFMTIVKICIGALVIGGIFGLMGFQF